MTSNRKPRSHIHIYWIEVAHAPGTRAQRSPSGFLVLDTPTSWVSARRYYYYGHSGVPFGVGWDLPSKFGNALDNWSSMEENIVLINLGFSARFYRFQPSSKRAHNREISGTKLGASGMFSDTSPPGISSECATGIPHVVGS